MFSLMWKNFFLFSFVGYFNSDSMVIFSGQMVELSGARCQVLGQILDRLAASNV